MNRKLLGILRNGKAIWDLFPSSYKDESYLDSRNCYLTRLVPMSRFILLDENMNDKIKLYTNGYAYDEEPSLFREPMCTVKINEDNEYTYLKIDLSKHVWRNLFSVLSLSKHISDRNCAGAYCMSNLLALSNNDSDKEIKIWTGGLVTGDKGGDIIDVAEWEMPLPLKLLKEDPIFQYQKGVEMANTASSSLSKAISTYCKTPDMQKESISPKIINCKAQPLFWSVLDSSFKILIDTATDSKSLDGEWRDKIYEAMRKAYEHACPRETPRQIQAFAQGKRQLQIRKMERTGNEKET